MNRLELELFVGKRALDVESGSLKSERPGVLPGAVVTIKRMQKDCGRMQKPGGVDPTGRTGHWTVRTVIHAEQLLEGLLPEPCNSHDRIRIIALADCEPVLIEDVHLSKALAYSVERAAILVQDMVDRAVRMLCVMETDRQDPCMRVATRRAGT